MTAMYEPSSGQEGGTQLQHKGRGGKGIPGSAPQLSHWWASSIRHAHGTVDSRISNDPRKVLLFRAILRPDLRGRRGVEGKAQN